MSENNNSSLNEAVYCLVVDGNNLLNREFYGIHPLKTKTGIYTNAVLGFANKLIKNLQELNPVYAVVAFDTKAPTFRHKEYDGYKASRKGMPEELAMQLPYAKEVAECLGFKTITKEGYEADDIIGTIAHQATDNNVSTIILSGDRDTFQLISDSVTVRFLSGKEECDYTVEKIEQEYNILPAQFVDLKALMGDKSDEIPGVRGIGEKTALKLIQEHNSVCTLYEKIDTNAVKITPKNLSNLKECRELAYMSRKLAMICTSVPLDLTLKDYEKQETDKNKLSALCAKLELRSIAQKLNLNTDNLQDEHICTDNGSKNKLELPSNFFDTVQYKYGGNIKNIDKYFSESKYLYVSVADTIDILGQTEFLINDGKVFYQFICNNNPAEQTKIKENFGVLLSGKYKICAYSVKELYSLFLKMGLYPSENIFDFDISLAAYILNPTDSSRSSYGNTKYGINKLAYTYLSLNYEQSAEKDNALYMYISEELKSCLKENEQEQLYSEVEFPLAFILAEMEIRGFKVDKVGIEAFGQKLSKQVEELQSEIYTMCFEEFNLNSPKKLGEILFEKLNLPFGKHKKRGYSTNIDVLEKLRDIHPVINKILEYRSLSKLKVTYCDGLVKMIGDDGKLHTNFNQTITATGRLSSTEPNLHNIPVRTERGRELRKFFIPQSSEYVLIDADYSQIELRLLAHISGDETLTEAFSPENNIDIHTLTASSAFGVPFEEVTKEMRGNAKAINFGIIYGMSDFSLSEDLKIPISVAREYIDIYFATYPKVKVFMEEIVKSAKEKGYVSTIFNRRRNIPELIAVNKNIKSFGERIARNTPIQGTAADIIKLAMINCDKKLKENNLESRIILQIHDELIIESPIHEVDAAKIIVKTEMENVIKLSVPLIVDISTGNSWYDAKN